MNPGETPLTPEQTAAQEAQAAKEGYLHRDAVALDIGVDELADGPMDMTISTRLGIAAQQGKWWGKLGCHILDIFQVNHDPKAAAGDLERAAAVTKDIEDSGVVK